MKPSPLTIPARLLLIRHGESEWNHEQRFTGWADVGLTPVGEQQMQELGRKLVADRVEIDRVFVSRLKRCMASATALLHAMNAPSVPQTSDWRLNERHYGALTGRSKASAVIEFGGDAVLAWRRSYRAVPPPLSRSELGRIAPLAQYPEAEDLPEAESLAQTARRVADFWKQCIRPAMEPGRTVAVIGHGNSLRALAMLLEDLSESEVMTLEIANGELRTYSRSENGRFNWSGIWRPSNHSISQVL